MERSGVGLAVALTSLHACLAFTTSVGSSFSRVHSPTKFLTTPGLSKHANFLARSDEGIARHQYHPRLANSSLQLSGSRVFDFAHSLEGRRNFLKSASVSALFLSPLLMPNGALAKVEDELQPQSYYQQLRDAMPLKTMRGIWNYKENKGGKICDGTLTFRGQLDNPNRGDVAFDGGSSSCYTPIPPVKSVKGKWLMKPARFERTTIQFNARWKLKSEQGTFIYRGDVTADASVKGLKDLPDATIQGEILKDFGKEDYRKVGTFFASLRDKLPKEASEPQEVPEGRSGDQ